MTKVMDVYLKVTGCDYYVPAALLGVVERDTHGQITLVEVELSIVAGCTYVGLPDGQPKRMTVDAGCVYVKLELGMYQPYAYAKQDKPIDFISS